MRVLRTFFFVIVCIIKLITLLLYQLIECIIFNLYRVMVTFGVLRQVLLAEARVISALNDSPYPLSDMKRDVDYLKVLTEDAKERGTSITFWVSIRGNGTVSSSSLDGLRVKSATLSDTIYKTLRVVVLPSGKYLLKYHFVNSVHEW